MGIHFRAANFVVDLTRRHAFSKYKSERWSRKTESPSPRRVTIASAAKRDQPQRRLRLPHLDAAESVSGLDEITIEADEGVAPFRLRQMQAIRKIYALAHPV